MLIGIAAAAGLALFHLSQSSHVAATSYELDILRAELAEVRAEQQQLILQIGEARSPAVIEKRAKSTLAPRAPASERRDLRPAIDQQPQVNR